MNRVKNKILYFLPILVLGNVVFAQNFLPIKSKTVPSPSTKKLLIGDKLPNVYLKHIINYRKGECLLNDLKGKLTILDFWSSSCSSCIDLFPHLQQLRDQYKGQLQIILVNGNSKKYNDDANKITGILSKVKARTYTTIDLPVVYNCDALDSYFPHTVLPHEVWIDNKGIIIGITGAAEVNSANIKVALNGKDTRMHYKTDHYLDLGKHSLNELLCGNDRITIKPLLMATLVKGMIDGLNSSGIKKDENGNVSGLFVINQPLRALYRSAYRNLIHFPDNQISFENKDTTLFGRLDLSDPKSSSELYSYDLNTAPGKINELIQYMQSDLEKFFRLSVTSEKRELICYVIKAPIDSNRLVTLGKETDWVNKDHYINIINSRTDEVLAELNRLSPVPFIDETGLTKSIDMKLPEKLEDTAGIIKVLTETGFDVKKEKRLMDIVVIKDKN